ncbi:hypothetical protein [Shinella sp. NM-101]|uniref:hypothetical protein n=1 Tax=Shinella sp. NM-101 TaxID=2744455 RepID=UPI001F3843C5|nr:hypothetical protein [Shinella sp. NM-101]
MSAISNNPDFMALMKSHIAWLASCEDVFGPVSALHRYGRFHTTDAPPPEWLVLGPPQQCHANSSRQLLSRIMTGDHTIHYAEGFAVNLANNPVLFEHAWLVNGDTVIDPTLANPRDHLYFGIAFDTPFVMEALRRTGRYDGILTDRVSMRRLYGTPELFEQGLRTPQRDDMPAA